MNDDVSYLPAVVRRGEEGANGERMCLLMRAARVRPDREGESSPCARHSRSANARWRAEGTRGEGVRRRLCAADASPGWWQGEVEAGQSGQHRAFRLCHGAKKHGEPINLKHRSARCNARCLA